MQHMHNNAPDSCHSRRLLLPRKNLARHGAARAFVHRSITRLINFGWIRRSIDTNIGRFTISMHAIIAAAIIEKTGSPFTSHTGLIRCIGKEMYIDNGKRFFDNLPLIPLCVPIIRYYGDVYTGLSSVNNAERGCGKTAPFRLGIEFRQNLSYNSLR